MIRLRTLGTLDLRGPDGAELRSVLAQPKRFALLAYLAVATPTGFQRRDTLVALFWPELDHEHARAALRKALHGLRHELGDGVVVTRGDEDVMLAPEGVWCDGPAFEQLLAEGRRVEALELYRGDLLAGLYVSGAPEFERWLEGERTRLRRQAAAAAWAHASDAEARGEDMTALQSARRALLLSPDDEGAVRRMIGLLDRVGDRAGALHVYAEFARQLAADYEAEPSAETKALIEAVRQRVDRISGKFAGAPPSIVRRTLPPAIHPRWWLVGVAAGIVVVAGFAVVSATRLIRGRHSATGLGSQRAAQLVFTEPPPVSVQGGSPVSPPIQVTLRDALGNIVLTGPVTLALGSAPWPGASLSGTLTVGASNGLASFGNVRIDKPGVGYTLLAISGVARGTSASFRVGVSFTSVGAFYRQTCAMTTGHDVYCWGSNGFGQLGGSAGPLDSVPGLVGADLRFTQITGGGDHTCALASGGAVYCWGRNDAGQLGNGTTNRSSVPVQVSGSGTGALVFRALSSGAHHTCGIATGNLVWCWGSNGRGQLGNNSTADGLTPVAVTAAIGTKFASVSAGGDHSCGITTARRLLYCWGSNELGELGDSSSTHRLIPVGVFGPSGRRALTFAMVSAGLHHTCGVTTEHTTYCWGSNNHGQLGDGSTVERHTPVVVVGPGRTPLSFVVVSAGGSHTCGVTRASPAYCWGFNGDGELGDGTTIERHTPVRVAGSALMGWSQVSAGDKHTCGRRAEGGGNLLYCWGNNELGQLGDGTLSDRLLAVRVVQ
jgi:alpha-tubulin suppressor-like RCC1 family protein/DNA-binding SARP family transcriptional activator